MTRLLGLVAVITVMFVGCGEGGGTVPELPPIIQHWDDWEPGWSPDGSEIVVRSNRATRYVPPEDPRSVIYDIWHNDLFVLDTLGNAVQLTGDSVAQHPLSHESPDVEYPSWSPDGRIAFSSGDTLWVVERDGAGLREVLIYEPALSLQHVAWSPAGGRIAFSWTTGCSSTRCAPRRIGVLDLDTSSFEVLTDPTLSSLSPSWSADGSQLFYVFHPESGSPQVNRMNLDGTGVTTLFTIPHNGYDLAWSPCGDQIAFSQTVAPRRHQLSLMDPDGTNVRVLTEGEQASWSPDCSKLAFIRPFLDEHGYEGIDVWMIRVDGSEERRVTRRD